MDKNHEMNWMVRERERDLKGKSLHGSKLAVHLSGSCMAMFLSTPVIEGPLTRPQRQGWPRILMAAQQASLGGIRLKGATAGLHGIS